MRFQQQVGIIHQQQQQNQLPRNNCHINGNKNQVTHSGTIFYRSENENNNFSDDKCLKTLKSIIHKSESEHINNFDTNDVNRIERLLKFKTNTCGYFKNFIDTNKQCEDINIDLNGNDNENVLLIETLNLTEDNLSRFVTSTTQATEAYDNCVTNQSYKQQNCLSSIQRQRRGNLIKLDFGSMTKHEGPLQSNGGDSAGCSVESSPVDSLLDDQELVSPTPSSLADLSSPDPQELHEVLRSYPRGIINPNYPGFQHLAHTLAEHFIGHTYESNSSDSEISDDVDFDVTYRVGNLSNVNINMNDSNNNINAAAAAVAAIDLNRNKNNFGSGVGDSKEFEDGNVNLLMKSEPKVFCESKQLGLHDENQNSDYEHFTSDDEDEECCNLQKNSTEPQQMEFDEDEIADLSGEDDAAIKNELERIDRADNDFTESINCDLATYLQQYDYKMDLEKSYQLEECLTDEDNNKLPTPDILIEHNSNCNNKKVQNDEEKEEETIKTNLGSENDSKSTENLLQPDLIKSVTDTINTNDNNHEKAVMQSEISSPTENETNDNDVKIINQVQTEFAMANCSTKLSFDSATSAVDIIGDFGKEVEKEIGLIVSGYLNATNEVVETPSSPTNIENFIRPDDNSKADESVYDEKQFFEHLKCFSKMGDATLSKVEERIPLKNTLVVADEHDESNVIPTKDDSLIPTAIVKPKYQKLSFDERQLPIRGATETELLATSATITTTPRKVQKHLPKSQKHARKFVNTRASELSDNKEIISENIDCNSVAIVQPIKKVIDTNILRNEEEEEIERAKNSTKQELKIRNSKINEKKMSDFGGNNNLNVGNRKCFEREKEKFDVVMSREEKVDVVENDKKVPMKSQKNHNDAFDVYNIETALPVIDLEAIESHLMASAKEEEMKRKNDREAIRRRLAMNEEDDYLAAAQQRPIRKPNLQSRLQNGMNLQICFMNEAASDSESSDSETCPKLSQGMSKRKSVQRPSNLMSHRTTALNNNSNPYSSRPLSVPKSVMDRNEKAIRPMTLTLSDANDNNFFTHQARLQIEARMALAQAKDMAHMQMEFERQKQPMCPITELVHKTLEKVGMKVPLTKRRLSRQMLTNMNIAQLQIIINEFHSFIETLNEMLVKYLMDRDEISMRQDSMLIDIEDITRYLAEKEEAHLNNNNRIQQQQQRQHLDPKKAPAQRTTAIRPANNTYNNNSNKKSLVVNGNGHSSVITSISRENFEQQQRNRLHL